MKTKRYVVIGVYGGGEVRVYGLYRLMREVKSVERKMWKMKRKFETGLVEVLVQGPYLVG